MTCIIGLVDNGTVWMGGDSAGVAGLDVVIRKDAKVFINGEFIIGYTSSFRMGQLLRFKFNPPTYYEKKHDNDVYSYMCTEFIEEIRSCLKDGGYSKINDNKETGGIFLVGFRGRLFEIEADFQVGENNDIFSAVGCGEDYAKGSLYADTTTEFTPYGKIIRALEVAAHFSAGVRAPFVVEKK